MQVSVLLQDKGTEVVTTGPETPVLDVVDVLFSHRIGAVVVSADGRIALGILSERDVVRAMATRGPTALQEPASALMSTEVVTCALDTPVEQLMATMTAHRIRHIPVTVDGQLVGLVSIGDVVKHHIATLEHDVQVLHDYIVHPY
jgi:CBS domain-containing protein